MRVPFLLALAAAGVGAQHIRRNVTADGAPEIVDSQVPGNDTAAPKRFIVEFAPDADPNAAVDALTSHSNVVVLKLFDSDVFKGASLETVEDNVDSLKALDAVQEAWQSRRVFLRPEEPEVTFGAIDPNAKKVAARSAEERNTTLHHMTGVDKLHAQGIFGKGVVVAVVDTGIDYTHPALGGAIGPGNKVTGGYDLVGDGTWPKEPKAPDADPMDHNGHGTHVAGIIAGKDDLLTGVAPEATLRAYKVFSQDSSSDEDTLIDAFLMAYEDGADVITSSIGGLNGWTSGPWALVASRLVEQGVVVTISAGNDGDVGAYGASSGSSGQNVIAVASIQGDMIATPSFDVVFTSADGSTVKSMIGYRVAAPWFPTQVIGWPILPLGLDTTVVGEACRALPDSTPNLSGVVVLVRRGGCDFATKQANLLTKGASHVLFYTNEQAVVAPQTQFTSPMLGMLTAEDGARIISAIKAGGNVTADFNIDPNLSMVGMPYPFGNVASAFTSLGSTNELAIKPDIAAPGGQVFSSFLDHGYSVLSGTSMACPYVAGVAALYIGQHGGRKVNGNGLAKMLAMRIISSGEAIPWDDGLETGVNYLPALAPVNQVGAGIINATKVLGYTTTLSLARFALNDTKHFSRYQKVDVTNNGPVPVTYTFEQQPFSGMNTLNTDPDAWATPRVAWFEEIFALGPQTIVPEVSFPGSFTLKPGETRTAQFNFRSAPTTPNAANLPLYGGKVLIKGSNGEVLGVPYMGLAADLHRDVGDMFESPSEITTTRDGLTLNDKPEFSFDLSTDKQDFPAANFRLRYATTEFRWDIFESSWKERDWKYPPVVGEAGFVGSVTVYSDGWNGGVFNPETMSANDTISTPLRYVSRSVVGRVGTTGWWLGGLANGTAIAPGKYQMRLAALVPFGTPENADNWDVLDTPEVEVVRK